MDAREVNVHVHPNLMAGAGIPKVSRVITRDIL